MKRAQIKESFIVQYEQPFYKYLNGIWSKTTGNFEYRQEYERDDDNPLDDFLSQVSNKINDFLLTYYNTYNMSAALGNRLKSELITFFNDFLSEFEDNMNTINDTYDILGNPVYSGGQTTGRITLNTTIAVNQRIVIYDKSIEETYYNPQFIYKFNVVSLRSERW